MIRQTKIRKERSSYVDRKRRVQRNVKIERGRGKLTPKFTQKE